MGIKEFLCKCRTSLKYRLLNVFWGHFYYLWRPYIKYRGRQIQKKDKIKVLFVLAELGAWKTEELYIAMRKHPRFESLIGITESLEAPGSKPALKKYLEDHEYLYTDLDEDGNGIEKIKPDLLFYYKPYDASYPYRHVFKNHLSSLPVTIAYSFHLTSMKVHMSWEICDYSWIVLVENKIVQELLQNKLPKGKAKNVRTTGIPMMDILCLPPQKFENPWHDTKQRKRIIYAPHHSIKGTNGIGIEYATFLEFGDFMLKMAEKYKNEVSWAFKPHPTLYSKLQKIWGKERTNAYYVKWREMENSQVELGEYVSLFKYSDAMIHDCASFMLEYHYTKNPVLYLDLGGVKTDELNDFGLKAFNLCYKGHSESDIERFIQNVINGVDDRLDERKEFYEAELLPPNGKTASENIIDTILNDKTL